MTTFKLQRKFLRLYVSVFLFVLNIIFFAYAETYGQLQMSVLFYISTLLDILVELTRLERNKLI